jgi:hypothetical protein
LGATTIDVIGLHTKYYVDERKRHLLRLNEAYVQLLRALLEADLDRVKGLLAAMQQECGPRYKFAACTREFLRFILGRISSEIPAECLRECKTYLSKPKRNRFSKVQSRRKRTPF